MTKQRELTIPTSCMSKALDHEMTFVLLSRDEAAPVAIKVWIGERLRTGKNTLSDPKIREAISCLETMERQREMIRGDIEGLPV